MDNKIVWVGYGLILSVGLLIAQMVEKAHAVTRPGMVTPVTLMQTMDVDHHTVLRVYCDNGYRVWVVKNDASLYPALSLVVSPARDACPIDVNAAP